MWIMNWSGGKQLQEITDTDNSVPISCPCAPEGLRDCTDPRYPRMCAQRRGRIHAFAREPSCGGPRGKCKARENAETCPSVLGNANAN